MGAAVRGRNRVAVGLQEAVGVGSPGNRPFDGAGAGGRADIAGEDVWMPQRGAGETCGQIIFQPVGEMERRLFRHVLAAAQQFLRAPPADFDAAVKIGLRARYLEYTLGLE